MHDAPTQPTLFGTVPWLPQTLAKSGWWTTPVRAEYLAVLRIGIAVTMLYDQIQQYLPCLEGIFGPESTGAAELWGPSAGATPGSWSLFFGLHQSPIYPIALWGFFILTLWLGFRLFSIPSATDPNGKQAGDFQLPLIGWLVAGLVSVVGSWAQPSVSGGSTGAVWWLLPSALFTLACGFLAVRWFRFGRADPWFLVCCTASLALLMLGVAVACDEGLNQSVPDVLIGWSENFELLRIAFFVWILFTVFLGLGIFTRVSVILVWILAISFANLNPIVNHGEITVRSVILFYLTLCPSGAAWSVDSLYLRWRGKLSGPVYVPPWPLRMLLIQLAFIYCATGLFKLLGETWQNGNALYFSLADLYYSRMSLAQLNLPHEPLRWATWFILVWEISFPIWLLIPWTRTAALLSGVLFHIGTFTFLELGGFDWYMTVLYLPLLPWARWLGDPGFPVVRPKAPTDRTFTPAHRAANWGQRLLGWFIVWQLTFLVVANLGAFGLAAAYYLPDPEGAYVNGDRPCLTLPRKIVAVTDAWGELTQQPQFWRMYDVTPDYVNLPMIEVHHALENGPGHTVWKTHVVPSDLLPADLNHYFRFGRLRITNVEEFVVPTLSDRTESASETNEIWADEIANFVYDNRIFIRNYIRYRVRQSLARNPDLPEPAHATLLVRRYRTNPPGSPTIWAEPEDVPIARLLPGAKDAVLQAYNPVTKRFDALD